MEEINEWEVLHTPCFWAIPKFSYNGDSGGRYIAIQFMARREQQQFFFVESIRCSTIWWNLFVSWSIMQNPPSPYHYSLYRCFAHTWHRSRFSRFVFSFSLMCQRIICELLYIMLLAYGGFGLEFMSTICFSKVCMLHYVSDSFVYCYRVAHIWGMGLSKRN